MRNLQFPTDYHDITTNFTNGTKKHTSTLFSVQQPSGKKYSSNCSAQCNIVHIEQATSLFPINRRDILVGTRRLSDSFILNPRSSTMAKTRLSSFLLAMSIFLGVETCNGTNDTIYTSLGLHREHNGRILASKDTNPGEFPFFTQWGGCGATLIWEDILLTSASVRSLSRCSSRLPFSSTFLTFVLLYNTL